MSGTSIQKKITMRANDTLLFFKRVKGLMTKIPEKWKVIISIFLITKILILAITAMSSAVMANVDHLPFSQKLKAATFDVWFKWDTHIYKSLSSFPYLQPITEEEQGVVDIAQTDTDERIPMNASLQRFTFAPLLPLLNKIVGGKLLLGHYNLGLLVISNIALIFALSFLYELTKMLLKDKWAPKWSVIFMLLLPSAFVLQAAFSESLFLFFSIASFYFATKKLWLRAGICAALLALTRSSGFLIALPLFVLLLKQGNWKFDKQHLINYLKKIPFLAMPVFAWGIFMFYCYLMTGDFFAYSHLQHLGWGVSFSFPWIPFVQTLSQPIAFHPTIRLIIISVLFVISFFGIKRKRIEPEYAVFLIIFLILPLTLGENSWPGSILRYITTIFPLALIGANWITHKKISDNQKLLLLVVAVVLQTVLCCFWTQYIT